MTTPAITIVSGAGGVGKTTLSAAFAFSRARAGEKCVVITLDPARRLRDALSLSSPLGNDPILVREFPESKGALYACMLDSEKMWHSFATLLPESARSRIFDNRFFQTISSKFGGAHEFMALELIASLIDDGRFTSIVLDTAPTEGAHTFLTAADRIAALLSSRIYSVAMSMAQQATKVGKGVSMLTGWMTRGIRSKLEGLLGQEETLAIFEFFTLFEPLRETVLHRAKFVRDILEAKAALMLVTTADSRGVATLRDFGKVSLPVARLVLNRTRYLIGEQSPSLSPGKSAISDLDSFIGREDMREHFGPIQQVIKEELVRANLEEESIEALKCHFSAPIVLIPDMAGLDDQAALVEAASLSFS